MLESQAMERQMGGCPPGRCRVNRARHRPPWALLFVPGARALRVVSRSLLLRPGEISALYIDSARCFILFKEKGLVMAYLGTGIAAQTLGGVI